MPDNIEKVHESFEQQAEAFNVTPMNVQRKEHMAHIIDLLSPLDSLSILEVAAGTCACGRAMAQTASAVTCLDTTAGMLEVGMREARKSGLSNIIFVLGDAACLPFLDNSFDITFCRLAFHHIPEYEKPFSEMARALRPGGRLVLADLVAPQEDLRQIKEEIEIARDPSHAKTLSREEMLALFEQEHLTVTTCEPAALPVTLDDWLDVTRPSSDICDDIRQKMTAEIAGGEKTGFDPYEKNGRICFDQQLLLLIGEKP